MPVHVSCNYLYMKVGQQFSSNNQTVGGQEHLIYYVNI